MADISEHEMQRQVSAITVIRVMVANEFPIREACSYFRRSYLLRALEHTGGNVSKAATLVHVKRSTMDRFIQMEGLRQQVDDIRAERRWNAREAEALCTTP